MDLQASVHQDQETEMAGRKWEDLNMDCLVNIFGRVGLENRLLNVPYVCKSWYKATCKPQCWSTLDFTEGLFEKPAFLYDSDSSDDVSLIFFDEISLGFIRKYHLYGKESINKFFKFVAKRANVCATLLKIPAICTQEAMDFMSNECPNIKTLQLPKEAGEALMTAVFKWKKLENLTLPWGDDARTLIEQLSVHCNNLKTLEILNLRIRKDDARNLAKHLPNLKGLSIRSASIWKKNMLVILKSCTELEFLDARNCVGFDETDGAILKAAAHIRLAMFQGSTLYSDDDDDYY